MTTRYIETRMARLLLIGPMLLGLTPALAQDPDNKEWYGTLFTGLGAVSTDSLVLESTTASESVGVDFGAGVALGGSIGRSFGNRWRLEGQFTYQTSELDPIAFSTRADVADGDFSSGALSATGYYDFKGAGDSRKSLVPFVGTGVTWLQEVDIDFDDGVAEESFSSNEFGWHLGAGVRYEPDARWFLNAELRYLSVTDITLESESATGSRVLADYEPFSLTIGFGRRF